VEPHAQGGASTPLEEAFGCVLGWQQMKVMVEIPESAQVALPPADALARDLLEAYAIGRYRQGSLTQKQVGTVLGLDRWSTEALLQRAQAIPALNLADYELERSGSR
jgi:hypothetical protein